LANSQTIDSIIVIGKFNPSYKDFNPSNFASLTIEIFDGNKFEKVAKSDDEGNFKFWLHRNFNSVDLYYSGIGINKKVFLANLKNLTDTLRVSFLLPKVYKKGLLRKPKCPKCGRRGPVISVVKEPVVLTYIENGDTITTQIFDNQYHLQTDVGSFLDPQWYCKEDGIFF